MLVNDWGNPMHISSKLPIFWLKKVAKSHAAKFNCRVVRVEIVTV